MTEPEPLQQIDRTYVLKGTRKLSYFSGCDYFRLASHPKVLAAVTNGTRRFGLNVSASRMTTGNHQLYQRLEKELADFFKAESTLVVPTGYVTNLIVAQTLSGNFSHVLIDEYAHASLWDAARLLDCPVLQFKHISPDDLKHAVERCGPEANIILLSDGLFGRDGSAPPLKDYLRILPKDALLLLDDAHGAGLLGDKGRGTLEWAGVPRTRIIQSITLSKAFGTYGGAILGTKALRNDILKKSRLFVGSTPLPLPLVNASLQSLSILKTHKALRPRLRRNVDYVWTRLREAGFEASSSPGPIIRFTELSSKQITQLRHALLQAGIYPPLVNYPGGPANGYFRFVVSSEHSREQLDLLATTLINSLPQNVAVAKKLSPRT